MGIQPFLAMTAAEISGKKELPGRLAWMASHFSPYGLGLSNLPRTLPPGSLLVVDDITPIHGHDPQIIFDQLCERTQTLDCFGVLLDFQRPDNDETAALVEILVQALPCPIAVSHHYARSGTFPVFLPPVPPSEPPEHYFSPWKGRDIWMELSLDAEEITITEEGSSFLLLSNPGLPNQGFRDETLFCHYHCTQQEDAIKFLLWRTEEDLEDLLKQAENFGVTNAVGLYQEFSRLISCP